MLLNQAFSLREAPRALFWVGIFLISFFGMFYLIEDMDNPLDYSEDSLITVNLDPLEEMIDNLGL